MTKPYADMTKNELASELAALRSRYEDFKAAGLSLDMSRGKPDADQLDLTEDMLGLISKSADCFSEGGVDCRNYGLPDGLPETKRLFAELLEVKPENIIVGGNSSLNLMYDAVARAMLYGVVGSERPWCRDKVKFLCPVPGYDRHFAICESLGIEMINIDMTPDGPDMDEVERIAASDPAVKGIWIVPKYSNPQGITCSPDTVRRLARMKTAAPDFRIFWDNAYLVHDFYDEGDFLLNLYNECLSVGNEDRVFEFASTSKISFPGAGVAALCASPANIKQIMSVVTIQTICYDKLNMLRHTRYFKSADDIRRHMRRHAELLRPKFELVLEILDRELTPAAIGEWIPPRGGYFISLDLPDGTARRTYDLCAAAGVKLTPVGATFPYRRDPHDRNLRIAPSYPPLKELKAAAAILCVCAKMAWIEKNAGK